MAQKLTVLDGRLRVESCGGALVLSPKPSSSNPCCCCDCEPKTYTYSTKTTDPPGKDDSDCPNNGTCEGGPAQGRHCCGETVQGYLNGPEVCCSCEDIGQPKAKIIYASLDNDGDIGGEQAIPQPQPNPWRGCPANVPHESRITDKIVDAELEELQDDKCRMRVSFNVQNDESCGAVRIYSATIEFFFEDPNNPLP